ncbi:MAG: ABC transporter transmembrane domain-containing protein, partial [Dehalococcoidia bacterium]|nr:ABC transporter transmembrane domain-containing protein [Dehalococcoidia bacterium]
MSATLRLLGYLRSYLPATALAVLSLLAASAFSLAAPWLIGRAIDLGVGEANTTFLLQLAAGVVLATIGRGVATFGVTYLGEFLAQRVAYDLRNQLYDHLQRLSFRFHDDNQTGQLMSRVTQDVEAARWFFSFGLFSLAQTSALALGIFAILLATHVGLALVTMAFLPLALFVAYRIGAILRPNWNRIAQQQATMTTFLQEALAGIRIVRAFAREEQ